MAVLPDDRGDAEDAAIIVPLDVLAAAAVGAHVALPVLVDALTSALAGGEPPGWELAAACKGEDLNDLFPPPNTQTKRSVRARCYSCPVQVACLASALRYGDKAGMWGGTNESDRVRLRRALRPTRVLAALQAACPLGEGADGTQDAAGPRDVHPARRVPPTRGSP